MTAKASVPYSEVSYNMLVSLGLAGSRGYTAIGIDCFFFLSLVRMSVSILLFASMMTYHVYFYFS